MLVRESGVWGKVRGSFSSSSDFFDSVLMEIQGCLVEINDLQENKGNPKEVIARLAVYANLLAKESGLTEKELQQHSTQVMKNFSR